MEVTTREGPERRVDSSSQLRGCSSVVRAGTGVGVEAIGTGDVDGGSGGVEDSGGETAGVG